LIRQDKSSLPVQLASQNHLLAALALPELKRILLNAELIELKSGNKIYDTGERQQFVYFPITSVITLLYVLTNGISAEIAAIGNEGVVGTSLFMGGNATPNCAVVQRSGCAYRLPGEFLKAECNLAGPVLHLLLHYTQALITQMTQTAICHTHHSIEQQLSCWLLQNLDRSPTNSLTMTQQLIANTIGTRRERVTEAAGHLQRAGLIRYCRGDIEVLDRARLEKMACECYQVIQSEFDRLLKIPLN